MSDLGRSVSIRELANLGAVRQAWCGLLVKVEEARVSDFGAFGESKRVLYVDAEIPDRALNLRMAEQDLNGPKISGLLVSNRGFRPPERVRAVVLATKADARHPLVHSRAYCRVLM
jgi:hypothetical protein